MRGDSWIKVLLCGEVICLLLVVVAARMAFSWFFACVFLALAAPLLFSIGIEHSLRALGKKRDLVSIHLKIHHGHMEVEDFID